jgi:hypothetical protein
MQKIGEAVSKQGGENKESSPNEPKEAEATETSEEK